jgi:hypothetical protein
MNNIRLVKGKRRNTENNSDPKSKRKKHSNNSKPLEISRESTENQENDREYEFNKNNKNKPEIKNNFFGVKISLKNLKADLIAYIAYYLEVHEALKLSNLNRKIRFILLSRYKLFTPFVKIQKYLKKEKVEKAIDFFKAEYSDFLPSLLEEHHRKNLTEAEMCAVIQSVVKTKTQSEILQISNPLYNSIFILNISLASNFSKCKKLILDFPIVYVNILEKISDLLKENNSIRELEINNLDIKGINLSPLLKFIPSNKTIKELTINYKKDYWHSIYEDPNKISILQAVEKSESIEKFVFILGNLEKGSQVEEAYFNMIKNNKSLKILMMPFFYSSQNSYNFDCFKENSTLEVLDLSGIKMKTTAIKNLCTSLSLFQKKGLSPNRSKINTLILKHNSLGTSKCLDRLAELINTNTYITKLDLSENTMNHQSFVRLCNVLLTNKSLKILNLERCWMGQDSFNYLISVLKVNEFLEEVNVSKNYCRISGKDIVIDMLLVNKTLKRFYFDGPDYDRVMVSKLLVSRDINKVLYSAEAERLQI